MNHSLAIKYLNEIRGNLLVILVNKIHTRYRKIHIVTGCFRKFLSIFKSKKSLKINNKSTAAIKGSVGNETVAPRFSNSTFTDKGVKNVINNNTLSNENKYKNNSPNKNGTNENQ